VCVFVHYEDVYNICPHNVSVTCACIMSTSTTDVPTTSQSRVCECYEDVYNTRPNNISVTCVCVYYEDVCNTRPHNVHTSAQRLSYVYVYYGDVYNTRPHSVSVTCVSFCHWVLQFDQLSSLTILSMTSTLKAIYYSSRLLAAKKRKVHTRV